MTTCVGNKHRWDAQKALAKGGIADGDLCFCGQRVFGDPVTRPVSRAREIVAEWWPSAGGIWPATPGTPVHADLERLVTAIAAVLDETR